MLSKNLRFHSRGGVRHTYKDGKTVRLPGLSLIYAPNRRNYQRFAVVISKKVYKSSVKRNTVRRRVYEAVRLAKKDLQFDEPYDCVFVVYSADFLTMPFSRMQKMVRNLIKRSRRKAGVPNDKNSTPVTP